MGAWIETYDQLRPGVCCSVAPYVGAWIETYLFVLGYEILQSHPTWVRGLKLERDVEDKGSTLSHPTWVRGLKHIIMIDPKVVNESHPTWVRGLKHLIIGSAEFFEESHPTWVRGLKLYLLLLCYTLCRVAPYVGAWIETLTELLNSCNQLSRTLRGCVD